MKKNLLLLLAFLPLFSFSQSCPDVNAIAIANQNGVIEDTLIACFGDTIYLKDNGSTPSGLATLTTFQFFVGGSQIGSMSSQSDSVLYVVNQDGISEIQYFVTDSDGCRGSYYSLFIVSSRPEVTFQDSYNSCVGDSLHLSFDPPSQDTSYRLSRIETNMLECMNDGGLQTFSLNISGVSPATITAATDINFIRIAMEHNRVGQLEIKVACPNAQEITIMNFGAGNFEDFGDPVAGGGAPPVDCNNIFTVGDHYDYDFGGASSQFTVEEYIQFIGGNVPGGDYYSDDDFSGLIGCPINGTWILTITDNQNNNDGSIGNFGIDFNTTTIDVGVPTIDFMYDANAASSYWTTTDNYTYLSADLDTLIYSNTVIGTNNYTYHLIDGAGCEQTYDVVYEITSAPTVSAGGDGVFCEGTSLNGFISSTGVASDCEVELHMYDSFGDGWNQNSLSITVSGNTTDYAFANGGFSSETILVPSGTDIILNYNDVQWADETSYYIILGNDTLFSDGLGGTAPTANGVVLNIDCATTSFFWTPNDGTLSDVNDLNPEVNAIGNLEYVLHYVDVANPTCSVTDTVVVSINENPIVQDTAFSGCFEDNVTVDPNPAMGQTPYTENWYGEDPMSLVSGDYLYTVTDANNCSATTIIHIEFSDSMYFSSIVITDADCFGDASGSLTFLYNGGTSPVTFDWQGVNYTQIPAGNHQLIATDVNGCKDTLDYVISEPAEIVVTGVVTDVQTVNDGEVDVAVIGGTGSAYTYSWSNGEMTEDITGLGGGDFIVTVTDSLGCTEVDTFTVVDPFLGIGENIMEGLQVYPNPVKDLLNIRLDKTYSDLNIQLFDSRGTLVFNQKYSGIQEYQISMAHLVEGTYFLKLDGGEIQKVIKVVKTN